MRFELATLTIIGYKCCEFKSHWMQLYFLRHLDAICTKMTEMSDLCYLQKPRMCQHNNYVVGSAVMDAFPSQVLSTRTDAVCEQLNINLFIFE